MSPKFKGDQDDWLDDEGDAAAARSRSAVQKFSHAKAVFLPTEQANAVVVEVYPNQCRVKLDRDGRFLLCSYRRSGVVKNEKIRERSLVAAGDRVKVSDAYQEQGVVEGVCVRRNKLSRPAPGQAEGSAKTVHQVIAANLDKVVVVASAKEPDFSAGLVDRFLIGIQAGGIEPLICVTKTDLLPPPSSDEAVVRPWDLYRDLGFTVIEVCSKKEEGITALRQKLVGQSVLFCGASGVGKTSLLRVLLGKEIGRVGEVSQSTGKGRHTTTATVLLGGPDGSQWLDSPGVREFGLAEVLSDELLRFFPEFHHLKCPSPDCRHYRETDCLAGGLPRYSSYVRILESLLADELH